MPFCPATLVDVAPVLSQSNKAPTRSAPRIREQTRNDQSLRDFVSIDCRLYGDRVIDTLNLTSLSA